MMLSWSWDLRAGMIPDFVVEVLRLDSECVGVGRKEKLWVWYESLMSWSPITGERLGCGGTRGRGNRREESVHCLYE